MTAAEPSGNSSATDRWNALLGLAVIALTAVSAFGWVENRKLSDRVSRLEATATATGDADTPRPATQGGEAPFTTVSASIDIRDSASLGDVSAPVAIVEFSDFQCPFCARHFATTFKRLQERYIATRKIQYVFRHSPLEEIHPKAMLAAKIAECSRRQGLFWNVHDRFFTQQRVLPTSDLRKLALTSGLEPRRFDECLDGLADSNVLRDVADARALGVAGTPMFFIGRIASDGRLAATRVINGARPFEVFETVLESMR